MDADITKGEKKGFSGPVGIICLFYQRSETIVSSRTCLLLYCFSNGLVDIACRLKPLKTHIHRLYKLWVVFVWLDPYDTDCFVFNFHWRLPSH